MMVPRLAALFVLVAAVLLSMCHAGLLAQEPPPAAAAPARVYHSDIHETGDAEVGPGPAAVALVGARGGAFNGKVVVESASPLAAVKGTMSDLKAGAASIPASQTIIRYAAPWDNFSGYYCPAGSPVLLEAPRAEVAPSRGGKALVPVWLTVRVPRDAAPGKYTGTLSIEAAGRKLADVPVTLEVGPWTLPDTQDYTTWIELIQSPDTLAVEYKLPLWSERHWQMIAATFRHIREIGSRVVYIPLIARTNQGHSETMVRWIKKGDGKYDYDFTIMDKYLDLVQQNMGRPKMVVFYAWEVFLEPPKDDYMAKINSTKSSDRPMLEARVSYRGKGPPVTVLDPATGKTETVLLPQYRDPASKALWQPVWDGIRQRMRQRGLEQAMMLGTLTDWYPAPEDATVLRQLSGDIPWVSCSHHAEWRRDNVPVVAMPTYKNVGQIGYTALALSFQLNINPEKERHYGWKKPMLHAQYWRGLYFVKRSLSTCRHAAEVQITGEQRGLAHLGADFWFCIRDDKGRRSKSLTDLYPESYWHNLSIYTSLLAPGPDGPVATAQYEVLREGVQECEARIAIERALTEPALRARLGDDLAARAQKFLDQQHKNLYRAMGSPEDVFDKYGFLPAYRTFDYDLEPKWDSAKGNAWFIRSGWAQRVGQLFALADEVQKKLR